ncbi:hypothetical protein AB1Y20_004243 [Prymnesium parvum]|uniref:Calmodulin n=1 Tax=Prymnesium parvum TaxID=97485 RepID=A0AB34J6V2_PRYPA
MALFEALHGSFFEAIQHPRASVSSPRRKDARRSTSASVVDEESFSFQGHGRVSRQLDVFERWRPLTSEASSRRSGRIDHLGMPIYPFGKGRFKYARTYTIVYEHTKRDFHVGLRKEHRRQLLKDMKKSADFSCQGLRRLNSIFAQASGGNRWVVGRRTFQLVLSRHGVRDVILQQRLFNDLSLEDNGKIDYRDFICVLVIASRDSVEDKMDALFDVHEADGRSDGITISELLHVIMLEQRDEDRELIATALELMATEIREHQHSEQDDYWTPSHSVGLQRAEVRRALKEVPVVREFFEKVFAINTGPLLTKSGGIPTSRTTSHSSSRPVSRMSQTRHDHYRERHCSTISFDQSAACLVQSFSPTSTWSPPPTPDIKPSTPNGMPVPDDRPLLSGFRRPTLQSSFRARPSRTSFAPTPSRGSTSGTSSEPALKGLWYTRDPAVHGLLRSYSAKLRASEVVKTPINEEAETMLRSMLENIGTGDATSNAIMASAQARLAKASVGDDKEYVARALFQKSSSNLRESLASPSGSSKGKAMQANEPPDIRGRRRTTLARHHSGVNMGLKELQIRATMWSDSSRPVSPGAPVPAETTLDSFVPDE